MAHIVFLTHAGTVPESIGNLTVLKELRLFKNKFSGEFKDITHTASLETSIMTKTYALTTLHTQARFPARSGSSRHFRR